MSHHHRADEKAKKLARKLEEQEEEEAESQQLDDPTNNTRSVSIDERRDEYAASTFGGLKDYKARKRRKLHNQSAHQHAATSPITAHPRLFHAHTIHITGHTAPPARELAALITAHGGLFARHLDGKTAVTHIVAAGLPHKKRQELARYRVVRPEWVVDSVAAGKVRPWADYRLLEETPGQGKLRAFGGPSGGGGGGGGSGRNVVAAGQKTDGASGRKGGSGWPAGSPLSRGGGEGEENVPSGIEGFVDDASLPDEIEDLIGKESMPEEIMGLVSGYQEGRAPRNTGSVEAVDEAGAGGRGFTGTGTVDSDIESAGDMHMSQAELLTPREELEEYDAPPGQHSPNISAGEREELKEPEEQEEVDVEPPPGQGPSPQQPSQELMAAFLSKPGIRSQTVLDPNFLNSYFSHSRLHHLSTWKSKIRLDLAPHLLTLAPKKHRPRHYILHADLDSFFASVSLLTRPELATKPVAIAHGAHDSTGGSEIAACNYPARSFGLKAGMWMSRAKALCPELTVLGYEFAQYEAASRAFYGVVKRVGAERIHAGSVDEVLLDVSNLVCDADDAAGSSIVEEEARALEIAEGVRRDVRAATGGLEVSVGVGGNVLLAKLALRRAKPAGVCLVRAAEVAGFMDGVEVGELPGVGPSVVARVVEAFGTARVAEIRAASRERLRSVLGEKTGLMLWQYCRGVDGRVVGEVAVRKSLSVDVNWGVRFETAAQSEHFLHQLSAEVATRLHSERLHGRHLTLTIKQRSPHAPFKPAKHLGHGECTTLSKSTLLPAPTANASALGNAAVVMLRAMKVPAWELRGLGLTLTKLQAAGTGMGTGTGVGAGQGLLKFTKADPVAEGSSRNEATAANVPPWGRPLPKPYTRPKPASLLDSFLKKPPLAKTPAKLESHQPEPEPEPVTPATQFEIPEDVDESVIPFLPAALQERIREKQRLQALHAAAEPAQKNMQAEQQEEEEGGADPLSQPPNSQDDITVWRALPADIRALLRSEHAAEQARLSAASASAAPSAHTSPRKGKEREREKRQTNLPHTPRKAHPNPLPRFPWERT
ncbi:hypothetical protein DFP73DRAFT_503250, partial [Morchella snyderi]